MCGENCPPGRYGSSAIFTVWFCYLPMPVYKEFIVSKSPPHVGDADARARSPTRVAPRARSTCNTHSTIAGLLIQNSCPETSIIKNLGSRPTSAGNHVGFPKRRARDRSWFAICCVQLKLTRAFVQNAVKFACSDADALLWGFRWDLPLLCRYKASSSLVIVVYRLSRGAVQFIRVQKPSWL